LGRIYALNRKKITAEEKEAAEAFVARSYAYQYAYAA